MEDRITNERKTQLVQMFSETAYLLTDEEALVIIKIMERACARASAELEEKILTAMINGEEVGDSDDNRTDCCGNTDSGASTGDQ